jgi:hypothetical protein
MRKLGTALLVLSNIVGNASCALAAYFAMASYYGWNAPTGAAEPSRHLTMSANASPAVVVVVFAIMGIALLIPSWVIVFRALGVQGKERTTPHQAPSQPSVIVSSSANTAPIQRQDSEERIIVNVTPEYLMGIYSEGKTSAQADREAAPYIGKWVKWSNPINNTRVLPSGLVMVSCSLTPPTSARLVFMHFAATWADRFTVLNIGDRITVFGQIGSIDRTDVQLWSCELVS